VGGRDGAGGQAEAAGGSTDRRETTREERKLMAAVQISQQLEKDRARQKRHGRNGQEADAAGAGAAKKKKPLGVCVKTSSLDMPFDIRPGPKRCDDFD
jgi:hypothetical protein